MIHKSHVGITANKNQHHFGGKENIKIWVAPILLLLSMFFVKTSAETFPNSYGVPAFKGWDMGMCRIPTGISSTSPVTFVSGEIINIPIHINKYNDSPDTRDIYISGTPRFLQRVEMGESRYDGGTDKYSDVMGCFEGGIDFNQPDVVIMNEAAVQDIVHRFLDSTNPTYRYTTAANQAIQLEFFVDGSIGKVRITPNCTIVTSSPGNYDYKIVPGSNPMRFQKYNTYDYHYKPNSQVQIVIPVTDTYVTQDFGGYRSEPSGQIYVNGNVVIGGSDTIHNGNQFLNGKIMIVATGNIWVADSIVVDGYHDANSMPTLTNPNILSLFSQGVIKVVNPTSSSSPSVPSGYTYQPIGIYKSGSPGRFLPDPTIIETAITVSGGGWGAEQVGNRREYSGSNDILIVRGAICESVRGVIGLAGADGYTKQYYHDKRLIANSLLIVSPDGNEVLGAGNTHTVEWSSTGLISNVKIEYSINDGANWSNVNVVPNTGSYNWVLPQEDSNQCLIRLSDITNPNTYDISNNVFTIYQCQISSQADLNQDCKVDFIDFAIMAQDWPLDGNLPLAIMAQDWLLNGNSFDPGYTEASE